MYGRRRFTTETKKFTAEAKEIYHRGKEIYHRGTEDTERKENGLMISLCLGDEYLPQKRKATVTQRAKMLEVFSVFSGAPG